jgi:energy-coupling factor transporter ATP-binding protein EcfA2
MSRLEELVKANPDFFEDQVIACFIASNTFTMNYSPSILDYSRKLKGRNKLTQNKNRVVFAGVLAYRELNDTVDVIPRTWLDDYVRQAVQDGKLLPQEVGDMSAHLDHLYERATPDTVATVDGGAFRTWFDISIAEDVIKIANALEDDLSVGGLQSLVDEVSTMSPSSEVQEAVSFDEAFAHDRGLQVAFVVSQLGGVNKAIGNGFRKGESTLVAGATGGGKTVFATMLAGDFSSVGIKTVFVTTEQKPHELLPRILSSRCNIPFEQFSEMGVHCIIPPSVSNVPDYMMRIAAQRESMKDNLKFLDWSNASGKTAQQDLEADLLMLHRQFPFEAVIFDWIGGALSKTRESLREVYMDAANKLHDIAKKHHWIVVMFAQLNKRMCDKKKYCNSTMLAEATAMADNATNAIYISALRPEESTEVGASYNEVQYFNIDKARKGPSGSVMVVRDFAYQRFTEPHNSSASRSGASANSLTR